MSGDFKLGDFVHHPCGTEGELIAIQGQSAIVRLRKDDAHAVMACQLKDLVLIEGGPVQADNMTFLKGYLQSAELSSARGQNDGSRADSFRQRV